jgi:branched-chain amino acid transport system permease protein
MNYILHLVIFFDVFLIVALSLNIVVGYLGLLTLAHAGFFAVGAYAYALASLTLGWNFIAGTLLGIGLGMALSLLLSLAAWRFRGDIFVLYSLAMQAVLYGVFYNWWAPGAEIGAWNNLTNGAFGLSAISRPTFGGWTFDSLPSIAALFSCMAALFIAMSTTLLRSPWGLLLKIVRDDELAARGLGKDARLAKLQAMAIACGMAAAAGAMYASYVTFLDPSSAALDDSILFLSMVIVGGVGNSVQGPFVGTLVLLLLPEALRFMRLPDATANDFRLLIYGLLLVSMMHLRPQGIAGDYKLE